MTHRGPRLAPLPRDHAPELQEMFAGFVEQLGFIPNSTLTMQLTPELVHGLSALSASVWGPHSRIDLGTKRLIAHACARAAGCHYSMAHTITGAFHLGVPEDKLFAVWDYRTSPLYSDAERAAMDFAAAASQVPNAVTDEMFAALRTLWRDEEVAEIVGVVSIMGFFTRWNGTIATTLEDEPLEIAEKYLGPHGWTPGKHKP